MTTGKIIALTRQTLVGKVMSLLLNMLSRLVIAFLSKLYISANGLERTLKFEEVTQTWSSSDDCRDSKPSGPLVRRLWFSVSLHFLVFLGS